MDAPDIVDARSTRPDTASVRRAVVAVTIVSFSIAALLGIAALLSDGDFGVVEIQILATTVVVGCASVLTLACLVPLESRWSVASALGFLVTLGTAALALLMIWVENDWGEGMFRTLGVGITLSVTMAQVCLLLGVSLRRPSIMILVWATVVVSAVVAGQVIAIIVGDNDPSDGFYRLLGIMAILDVLGTLVTIALGIFGPDERSLTLRVPPAMAERLRVEASESGRPVDELVNEALERYWGSTVD